MSKMIKFPKMYLSCKTLILLIVIVLTLINCARLERHNYQVEIHYYNNTHETTFIDKRNGIVAFDFIGLFKSDTLTILVNNKRLIKEVLNTDEVTGSALLVELDSLKNIKEIRLKINNEKEAIIHCDYDNQLFIVTQKDNVLTIKGVTSFKPKE